MRTPRANKSLATRVGTFSLSRSRWLAAVTGPACLISGRKPTSRTTIMSLLADIYISRDDEAVRYDTTPDQFADRAQYKGITPLELSMFWAIVRGVEWDVASMDEFPCLLQQDG